MFLIRQLLTCLCVPAFCGYALAVSAPDHYLTPTTPYVFSGASGNYVQLPSGYWAVFNAPKSEDEGPRDYWVTDGADRAENKDDAGKFYPEGMLRFQGQLADVDTYLALGIRNSDGSPFRMLPKMAAAGAGGVPVIPAANRIRSDVLHMTLCFSVSDSAPDVHALQYMYRAAADRLPDSQKLPVAAKLGLYVGMDGYFYFTRVVPTMEGSGTGRPKDTQILFCKSLHTYSELGSGEVTIEVEFRTFASEVIEDQWNPGTYIPQTSRAYRILAYKGPYVSGKPASEKTVLTEGRGYRLTMIDPEDNNGLTESTYTFDYSTLDQGEWIFPIDDTTAYFSDPQDETGMGNIDIYNGELDTLDSVGFSAQSGGFVSAYLTTAASLVSNTTLSAAGISAGGFAPYLNPQVPAYDLYSSWAGRYGVNLMKYADASTMALGGERTLPDHVFNAFLLDMDPEARVEQKLIITGVVTGEKFVTLSVVGPEGSNLASALGRAAALRIRRAATPDGIASAEAKDYAFRSVPYSTDGSVAFVLPKEEAEGELPFMKAELVARELPAAE